MNGMTLRIFRRTTWCMLLAVVLCGAMTSCRRAAERAGDRIRIESVEQVRLHGLSGADLTLRIRNDNRFGIQLREAGLDLWYADAYVGSISLREGVEVPRRSVESVVTRWRFRVEDPLALYALSRRVTRCQPEEIEVSFRLKGHGGAAAVHIREERMPLSEFLRIFGLTCEQLNQYLDL